MAIEIGSLSSKGQITIPKSIRKKLNLTTKNQLVAFEELQDGRVLIKNYKDNLENNKSTQMNLLNYLSTYFKTVFVVTESSNITTFYKSLDSIRNLTVISSFQELSISSNVDALIVTTDVNKIAYIEKMLIMRNGKLITLFENK